MAVDYSLPAWLNRPTDTAGPYVAGLHIGAQLAQERNRLAQQSQEAAMLANVRMEESNRRAVMEQQQIEMEKARQQAEQGLRKQQLDMAQQAVDLKIQSAARQVAAHNRYAQLIQSGVDPAKALLDVGPDLGISMVGAAQLYKAGLPHPALPPAELANYGGQQFLKVPQHTGDFRYQQIKDTNPTASGPLKGQQVLDPEGHAIPGLIAVPGVNGGMRTLNVPDRMVRMAQRQLDKMEKSDDFGMYLMTDTEPVKGPKEDQKHYDDFLRRYRAFKTQYDKLRSRVDDAMDAGYNQTGRGPVAPDSSTGTGAAPAGGQPYPDGKVLYKRDGSRWIVQGGVPVPYPEQNAEPADREEDYM